MASQHNATHIEKGSEEPHSINTNRGHMTHHSEHTSNGSITCLSTDNYKRKGCEPDYLQRPIKIVAEVQATRRSPSGTTTETDVSSAKHN